jgi:hypothetical protein
MATGCSKKVSVQGWVFEVRRARRDYECFYCGNRIPAGMWHAVEYRPFVIESVKRYHIRCFNEVFRYTGAKVYAEMLSGEATICRD